MWQNPWSMWIFYELSTYLPQDPDPDELFSNDLNYLQKEEKVFHLLHGYIHKISDAFFFFLFSPPPLPSSVTLCLLAMTSSKNTWIFVIPSCTQRWMTPQQTILLINCHLSPNVTWQYCDIKLMVTTASSQRGILLLKCTVYFLLILKVSPVISPLKAYSSSLSLSESLPLKENDNLLFFNHIHNL